jgi:Ca2+-binding RTX toxin-like protein
VSFRSSARLFPLVPATALLILVTTPAGAASSHVGGWLLTIAGDDGQDGAVVTCEAGDVLINGSDPSTGPAACADVERIVVHLGGGRDTADLSAVDDTAFPALTSVRMRGGADADHLVLPDVGASVMGGGGDDLIEAGAGDDVIAGGAGIDEARVVSNTDIRLTDSTLTGYGSDTLVGIDRASIYGFGPDPVTLDASEATIPTVLVGGDGDDTLMGGTGEDYLSGSRGNDVLQGGAGKDELVVDEGDDAIDGGPGSDVVASEEAPNVTVTDSSLVGIGNDALTSIERASIRDVHRDGPMRLDATRFSGRALLVGAGAGDTLIGGANSDVLAGRAGDDLISGKGGDDLIRGGFGFDTTYGGLGDDTSYGGRDADVLHGDEGSDTLVGGRDADRLLGGNSSDVLRTTDGDPGDLADGQHGNDKCLIDHEDSARSCERGGVLR